MKILITGATGYIGKKLARKLSLEGNSITAITRNKDKLKVLDAEFLGMGVDVQNFGNELADFIGVPHKNVTCVNTGTSALQLALSGLDWNG